MTDRHESGPPEEREARGVELWLAPFFRDSSLWPVTITTAAIFVLFGASGLLLAFVEHNPFALMAVVLLAWTSADLVIRNRRRGRSRLLLSCIVGFWLLSAAVAVAAHLAGWF